jgi:hypothetical protein
MAANNHNNQVPPLPPPTAGYRTLNDYLTRYWYDLSKADQNILEARMEQIVLNEFLALQRPVQATT